LSSVRFFFLINGSASSVPGLHVIVLSDPPRGQVEWSPRLSASAALFMTVPGDRLRSVPRYHDPEDFLYSMADVPPFALRRFPPVLYFRGAVSPLIMGDLASGGVSLLPAAARPCSFT